MSDIFISYSRKDSAFVRQLYDTLTGQGRQVWVDWEDIPPAAQWRMEIYAAIEAADAFVFVISPDSAVSVVCGQELAHAEENHKRIIPILYREAGAERIPTALADRNWVYFRPQDDYAGAVAKLLQAADTDLEWVRAHTRLLVRAREWQNNGQDKSFLLRGADLQGAETWLSQAAGKSPPPAPLQNEYLLASQKAQAEEIEHLRQLYQNALSRQLAAQAELLARGQPDLLERSVLLAAESLLRVPNAEADQTLRTGIALLPHPLALYRFTEQVNQVALSPDGSTLAIAGDEPQVEVWQWNSGVQVARLRQEGGVSRLAFSPDGKLLAAAGGATSASLWRLPEGELLAQCSHEDRVTALGFAPDGKWLATAGLDGTVRLWDSEDGQLVARLEVGSAVGSLAVSPDGRYLATGSQDYMARAWDLSTYKEASRVEHGHERPAFLLQLGSTDIWINGLAFSPDGTLVASGGNDGQVIVWQVETGQVLARMVHQREVHTLAFSPDGRSVASGSMDRTARLWEARSGAELRRFPHGEIVNQLKFSQDGQLLGTASGDHTARIWHVESGQELARMTHPGFVSSIDLTPTGESAVSASWDGTVRGWSVAGGAEVASLLHPDPAQSVAISPDRRFVATRSDGETSVFLWDVEKAWQPAALPHAGLTGPFTFTRDGKRLLTTSWDGGAKLWELESRQALQQMELGERAWAIALSPEEDYFAAAVGDQDVVSLWRLSDGLEVARLPHGRNPRALAFSPDGRLLASGGNDARACAWEVPGGRLLAALDHGAPVSGVAFHPDGESLATASWDGAVRVYSARTWQEIKRFQQEGEVSDLLFSPDGRLLAARLYDPDPHKAGSVTLWDFESGAERFRLQHEDIVHTFEFSRDGRYLVTASQDHTARVWEVAHGREVVRITHGDLVVAATISQDGEWLGSAGYDRLVKISPLRPEGLVRQACARLTRDLSPAEWAQYLPGEPYRPLCPPR